LILRNFGTALVGSTWFRTQVFAERLRTSRHR